jgi:DNA-binding transcriptional LysR family regulator
MMLRRFEMAIAIDTHRSFQRAARALGVSQPALTRALQTLETEFGARLFERGNGECAPTAFGQIVLARARRVVSEVAEAKREIDLLQGLETGGLRVGIGSAGPQQWVGRAIGDICAANPKLKVNNVELAGYHQPDALMAGEVDVAVGEPCDLTAYPDIVLARLPQRPVAFFCRKEHPLTRLNQVEIEDIAAYSFAGPRLRRRFGIHFPASSAMGSMSADGQYFEPSILCANWTAIREIVLRSDVVSARARAILNAPENRADLAVLPFEAPWFHTQLAIMWRRDRMPHPALKAFRDAVRRNEAVAMGDTSTIQVAA